jgi:hypothetical protein
MGHERIKINEGWGLFCHESEREKIKEGRMYGYHGLPWRGEGRERRSEIEISCGDSVRTYVTSHFDAADRVSLFLLIIYRSILSNVNMMLIEACIFLLSLLLCF